MVENNGSDDSPELLFFDTFSHINEDIQDKLNLDLVQFPAPVYIRELRIIPLGAKVISDFPGGNFRLGATNPSQFEIEFFVNDLSKNEASTFECLGGFYYDQNQCINMECKKDDILRMIPTDGLVLRGWYTTITLAVYGNRSRRIPDPIIESPQAVPPQNVTPNVQIPVHNNNSNNCNELNEWNQDVPKNDTPDAYNNFGETPYEYPQRPAPPETDPTVSSTIADDLKDDPVNNSSNLDYRYSRSPSKDQELSKSKREYSNSPEYRHPKRTRLSSYENNHYEERPERRRDHEYRRKPRTPPRTPPLQSPRISRPRSPTDSEDDLRNRSKEHSENDSLVDQSTDDFKHNHHHEEDLSTTFFPSSPSIANNTPIESPMDMDDEVTSEQFEPILSDDDISDEMDPNCELDELANEVLTEEFLSKTFNPFAFELKKFDFKIDKRTCEIYQKFIENMNRLSTLYQEKFYEKVKIVSDSESNNNVKLDEDWVDFCEQLVQVWIQLKEFKYSEEVMENVEKSVLETSLQCARIGLNYQLAFKHMKPGYNMRHIKAGLKLIENLSSYANIVEYIVVDSKFNVFEHLMELFLLQTIPLPIKLIIMKQIYLLIDTKPGLEHFLDVNGSNGYNRIISLLKEMTDIRLLFYMKSIVKKIHLYETLNAIQKSVLSFYKSHTGADENRDDNNETSLDTIENLFKSLLETLKSDEILFSQPKHFLPITAQFEINEDARSKKDFVSYYRIHNFLEMLAMLLNMRQLLTPGLFGLVLKSIKMMINNPKEFRYVSSDVNVVNVILKQLLQSTDDDTNSSNMLAITNENLENVEVGIEIAYKMETKYLVDQIENSKNNPQDLAHHLHSLFNLCLSATGRKYVLEKICMDDDLSLFLALIEHERKISTKDGSPSFKLKSPVLSYAVDIVDFVVRYSDNLDYMKKYGEGLFNLVKQHEMFEPSVAAMLQEMAVFLKPLEIENVFNYNDITPLIDLLKRSIESITTFPGDLIMGLRILKFLAISKSKQEYQELKYKYYVMQLYSADGISLIVSILDKLTNYFEQPMVHSYLLATTQGVLLMQILLPSVLLLKKMIYHVIRSRNIEFKDVSAIESLMKTYTLLHSVTPRSSIYKEAKKIQREIINILLVYTQTLAPDGVATGNVFKSLWTQMLGEVIKYTTNGLYHFIPGLMVLSELLPLLLPIPINGKIPLSKQEAARLKTERRLWSAHLHPQSHLVVDMIQTICTSSCPQLLQMINRVCVQMSDLAPNSSLLVSKTVVDLVLNEPIQNGIATAHLARLLHFLGNLLNHSSIKVSVLSILSGKLMELLSTILTTIKDDNEQHVLAQENVFIILQNLVDCKVSLLYNSDHSPELILASGLPSKELILILTSDILENFCGSENINLSLGALRTMLLLTEHDVTLSILKVALLNKKQQFYDRIQKIVESMQVDKKFRILMPILLELFRMLASIDTQPINLSVPSRTIFMSAAELCNILNWSSDENHFMLLLKKILNEPVPVEETAQENSEVATTTTPTNGEWENVEEMRDDLEYVVNILKNFKPPDPVVSENSSSCSFDMNSEISLPAAEGIVTQFALRISFILMEENMDDTLSSNFWLSVPSFEEEELPVTEQVECDLNDLIKDCLPPETNITSDCKRLLNLSASPQANRDRQQSGLCFRTRRVEVEPSTGRPEKKIFGKYTPRGRGFPRSSISRGDLFRSRPPNTSRPPSLHVDDFLAMESGGSSSYNKREIIQVNPRGRGRGRGFIPRGAGSGAWQNSSAPRSAVGHDPSMSHFSSVHHYHEPTSHFGSPIRGRIARGVRHRYPRQM